MSDLALVGIDLGKHTLHLHDQEKPGQELFGKKCSRQQMMRLFSNLPACTVAMADCAGAHFVARELMSMGIKPSRLPRSSLNPSSRATKPISSMPK